jgi:hypothetical protein
MKRELAERFNHEVENYRKALLYYARKCDWETFESKAGKLFDYVESVEFMELERRFFTIFILILCALVLAVVGLVTVDFEAHRELFKLKNSIVMTAVAVSSFELYFFIDYRIYTGVKYRYYKKRREDFIRNIEQDFQGVAAEQERRAA